MNEDVVIEKGIEIFYEIIFYSLILMVPLGDILYTAHKHKLSNV
jgi:hypothetical protein